MKSALEILDFPISDIEVFRTGRGSDFEKVRIGKTLEVFGAKSSLSRKGRPYDNIVDDLANNKTQKEEFIYHEMLSRLCDPQVKRFDYVHWCNRKRIRSTLDYMPPMEFGEAGLLL